MVNYLSYKDVGQGTSTVLKTVEMHPGIRKDLTSYQAEGGWIDSNLIRFRDGRAETIGGWAQDVTEQSDGSSNMFTGVSRNILAWAALDSSQWLAVGGNAKLELLQGGLIYDITPTRLQVTVNTLGTIQYSSIVTLTYTNHGLTAGDYIFVVSQNEGFNGITLAGNYKVLSVPDANTWTVDALTPATSTSANQFNNDFSTAFDHGEINTTAFNNDFNTDFGGSALAIVLNFLLPTGAVDNGGTTGYGGGGYNTPGLNGGGYNEPRAGVGGVNLRKWSLDNWGEDLLACPSGNTIYHWVKANGAGVTSVPVTNAPAEVNFVMVAEPARFVVAFGCNTVSGGIYDPLNIRWATEETLTDWTPGQYNTAGEYRLPSGNKIVGAIQTSQEIFVFTDTAVYTMVFLGANDPTNSIFQFTLIGTNISCISSTSMMTLNGAVYWMGLDNFYMYNGVVSIIPNTIGRWIFHQTGAGRYNVAQKEKVYCGVNKEFNEIWWFYPQYTETECGHYVKFNYLDGVWDVGTMDRTVWIDKGIFPNPLAISAEGQLFSHENGLTANGQSLNAYIESAFFDIDDGEQLTFVDRIVPDVDLTPNTDIQITIFAKKFPYPSTEESVKGPYNFGDADNKISCRARGRQIALTFAAVALGSSFALGKIRVASEIDGER